MSTEMTLAELEEAIKFSKETAQKYAHITYISEVCSLEKIYTKNGLYVSRLFYYFAFFSDSLANDFEREFTLEELVQIYKGAVFMEFESMGSLWGSVSGAEAIYRVISQNDNDYTAQKILDNWKYKIDYHKRNDFLFDRHENETLFEFELSKIPIKKQKAPIRMQTPMVNESSANVLYGSKISERKDHNGEQKNRDIEDRKNGIREKFLIEMMNLSLLEKLQRLASDDTHSPKYYPTSIVNESTIEVLQNLDKGLLEKLLERMQIPLRKSPWKSFRNKLYSVTNTEPFHGVHKSFY